MPFVVKNKLFRFEYWVEVMRRRPVALSGTAPVADLYLVRALVAIKMRVVPASREIRAKAIEVTKFHRPVSTIPAVDDKIVVEVP